MENNVNGRLYWLGKYVYETNKIYLRNKTQRILI